MSRRFKGRHGKVEAQPDAKPAAPVELTDENSTRDTYYPDLRYANQLNTRAWVRATSAERPRKAKPVAPPAE
jgi:hypothetical protein